MAEPDVPWSQYDQAYKQIHERLTEILAQLSTMCDESKYLPVRLSNGSVFYDAEVGKSADAWSITATSSGNNTIKTPSTGKKLRVKFIDIWNNGSADETVYLRFGSAGAGRFKKTLATKTGFALNLVGCNWEGAADEPLIVNLSAAGTVDVTVMGEEV